MKTVKPASANKKIIPKEKEEIKTDFPLSEKDEVKLAEKKLKEGPKKRS